MVVVVRTGIVVVDGGGSADVVGSGADVVVLVEGGGGRVITGAARWAEQAVAIIASAMVSDAVAVRPALRCTRT